jgi:hypothetical protein
MVVQKTMVTLVLTWGMQQESFLAWSIGTANPYSFLLGGGGGGGITTSMPPLWHGALNKMTLSYLMFQGVGSSSIMIP